MVRCDNCLNADNPSQEDVDGDGQGDVCDPPECGNGVVEHGEECDDGEFFVHHVNVHVNCF